jgi:hypothetical protein
VTLTGSFLHGQQLDRLVCVHRVRLVEIRKADDGQEPVLVLVDGNNNVIFFKQVYVLRPRCHSDVALLCSCQLKRRIFRQTCESLVKELRKDVGFVALVFGQHISVQICKVEIYDDIVKIVV